MDFGPILRAMNRNRVRFGLIVMEIALTLAIVANCVNMIRAANADIAKPSGFDDENIITVRSTPFRPEFKEDGYLDNSLAEDLAVLRAIPGVKAVSNTPFLPWQGGGSSDELRVAGTKTERLRTQIYSADEATIDSLGTHLVEGRNFTRDEVESDTLRFRALAKVNRDRGADGTVKEPVVEDCIVTKAYGELLFKDGKALGKRLEDSDGDQYQIVGVIDPFYNPYGWPIHTYAVFYPTFSRGYFGSAYLLRTEPGKRVLVRQAIEKALLAANDGRNLRVRDLVEIRATFQSQNVLVVRMLTMIVFLLLFVTSLGIVGLTAFSVSERTRQIGTRRALGARKVDILSYFLLENWIVTSIGLTLGIVLAYALNFALVSKVSGTKMNLDLIVAGVALLWIAGFVATLFPALRGVRVAPAVATRNV